MKPGGYRLTDDTYASLLERVTKQKAVPLGLQQDILDYYADPSAPIATKRRPKQWARVQAELTVLRGMPTTAPNSPAAAAEAQAEK